MVVMSVLATLVGGPAFGIANGTDVKDGEFPFATKLTMIGIPDGDGGRRDSSCSGGLIAPRWILTAGHCFKNAKGVHVSKLVAKKTTATVGRADLTGDAGQEAEVVEVRQSQVADVALAKLDREITGIAPMRLNRKKPKVGLSVRLTGFGLLHGDDAEVTEQLQVGRFEVTSVSKYELGMAGTAPKRSTSACPHDSGGPYFVPDNTSAVVYAVVSNGPTCPHTGPDASGRIDTIVPWILGVIGKDGPTPAPPSPSPSKTTPPAVAATSPPAEEAPFGVSMPVVAGVAGSMLVVPFLLIGMSRRKHRRFRRGRPG
ncbi:S1 family peptidase [Actinoplanes rectilineatus]|uniref:S1 family peptidase n=1 Tax=Actinoplanes rectilineatus TaxID=113571 RepID=UPI001FDFF14F|nr:trypsin-like serine protease [Actinoplanes rectilineatus]